MASKKKNTTGSKAGGGKKNSGTGTVAGRNKNSKGTVRNSGGEKAASTRAMMRRRQRAQEKRRIRISLCAFLAAIFGIIGYFDSDAILLNWFRILTSGLMGAGYFVLPPILLMIAWFVMPVHYEKESDGTYVMDADGKKEEKPFVARVICSAIIPLVVGGIQQMLLTLPELPDSVLQSTTLMWQSGILMESGGAISGQLALAGQQLISRPATLVLLALALSLLLLHAFGTSLSEVVLFGLDRIQDYQDRAAAATREDWDREDAPVAPPPARKTKAVPSAEGKRVQGDLPSDGGRGDKARTKPGIMMDISLPEEDEEEAPQATPAPRPDPEKEYAQMDLFDPLAPEEDDEEWVPLYEIGMRGAIADAIPARKEEDTPALDPTPVEFLQYDSVDELDLILADFHAQEEMGVLPEEDPDLVAGALDAQKDYSGPGESMDFNPQMGIDVVNRPAPKRKRENPLPQPEPEEPTEPIYQLPSVELLTVPKVTSGNGGEQERASTQLILEETLRSFGINPNITDYTRGPSVARFEMQLERGVKLSKLTNLSDDIALALGVSGVRIAAVPDKPSTVGIEVPNKITTAVPIRQVIDSPAFQKAKGSIAFALGMDIAGTCVISDIAKMPHLMIAGTTGSGKSVCINTLLISLLYKAKPEEVKLIMVDPKQVELQVYNGIPHLLQPVVTEAKKAAGALQWAVLEMTRRYADIAEVGARKIDEYNKIVEREQARAEKNPENAEIPLREKMPYIVIVIDELADLMMVAGKEVEESICRIAQLGRAAGMHLVVATQRPSADVITGLMKANIPSRIAFSVASAIESRIILDSTGAEKLVGKGDMLYHPIGANKSLRVQGCLISDEEVESVVSFVKAQSGEADYDPTIAKSFADNAQNVGEKPKTKGKDSDFAESPLGEYDEKILEAMDIVLDVGVASTSHLQRRLKLGHARAGRVMDQLEELGLIGPFEGSKPRTVLVTREEWAIRRQAMMAGQSEQMMMSDMNREAMALDLEEDVPPWDD